MKYSIRLKEDWLELLMAALLTTTMVLAILRGFWVVAIIASLFLVVVKILWWRQARARWCQSCQAPMEKKVVEVGDHEKIYYICRSCQQRTDSGVQRGYPE
jgi:hypothetical protein